MYTSVPTAFGTHINARRRVFTRSRSLKVPCDIGQRMSHMAASPLGCRKKKKPRKAACFVCPTVQSLQRPAVREKQAYICLELTDDMRLSEPCRLLRSHDCVSHSHKPDRLLRHGHYHEIAFNVIRFENILEIPALRDIPEIKRPFQVLSS